MFLIFIVLTCIFFALSIGFMVVNADKKKIIAQQESELAEANYIKQELSQMVTFYNHDISEAKNEQSNLADKNQNLLSQVKAIKDKLEHANNTKQELSQLVTTYAHDISEAKNEQGNLADKNQNLLSQVETIKLELARLKNIEDSANATIEHSNNIINEARTRAQSITNEATTQAKNITNEVAELKTSISELKVEQRQLKYANNSLQETLDLSDLNYYAPHYNFEKAIDFERQLSDIRTQQKRINTTIAHHELYQKDLKRLATAIEKLMLKAFNAEADLICQKVDYKNIVTYENRLLRSYDILNKIGVNYNVSISKEYFNLKIAELRLLHEWYEKKQDELEEQRRIKEIMRDELKADRDAEKKKAELEREAAKYEGLLNKLTASITTAQGAELEQLNAKISILQEQLSEVKENERAISQAQLTKSGYVYIISNIGSFGEDVYKVGMTRRLEPQERVDELGDASVPFKFDVHAMIYKENAPEFERQLHQELAEYQLNKVNNRKEFFKVSLSKIEEIAKRYKADIVVTKTAEAKEYYQTLAMHK